jgi:hypothetical protein
MRTLVGGSTPICITYRRGSERPVLKRTRRFVGWRKLVKNAIGLIADALDSIAYETEEKMELPADSVAVHWALEVDNPWDSASESRIVAIQVPEVPAAGTHFEIFKVDPRMKAQAPDKESEPAPRKAPAGRPVAPKNGSPEQAEVRDRLRKAILNNGLYDPEAGPPEL